MSNHERSTRTAPASRFNGGYVGHGQILPMEAPRKSIFKAALDVLNRRVG